MWTTPVWSAYGVGEVCGHRVSFCLQAAALETLGLQEFQAVLENQQYTLLDFKHEYVSDLISLGLTFPQARKLIELANKSSNRPVEETGRVVKCEQEPLSTKTSNLVDVKEYNWPEVFEVCAEFAAFSAASGGRKKKPGAQVHQF